MGSGGWGWAQRAEGGLRGLREAHRGRGHGRRIHTGTYLASFSQQRGAGPGTEAWAMIPGTRGPGGTAVMLRGSL